MRFFGYWVLVAVMMLGLGFLLSRLSRMTDWETASSVLVAIAAGSATGAVFATIGALRRTREGSEEDR